MNSASDRFAEMPRREFLESAARAAAALGEGAAAAQSGQGVAAPPDLLASRLQGQEVLRSAFYDVVRDRLGWSPAAAQLNLPAGIRARLARGCRLLKTTEGPRAIRS